jgi:hypothetical protein
MQCLNQKDFVVNGTPAMHHPLQQRARWQAKVTPTSSPRPEGFLMDGAEAGVSSGPERTSRVREDPDTPRRPRQARKDPGRPQSLPRYLPVAHRTHRNPPLLASKQVGYFRVTGEIDHLMRVGEGEDRGDGL